MTTKTFRGRSLEALLPQVRAELGEDAIVLRCREGLSGGIMGFFRRACVEIEAAERPAQGALAHPPVDAGQGLEEEAMPSLEVRTDRATATGLASAGVQLLVEQAAPFADQLRTAQRDPFLADDTLMGDDLAAASMSDPKLYGPQPSAVAPVGAQEAAGDDGDPRDDQHADDEEVHVAEAPLVFAPEPATPAPLPVIDEAGQLDEVRATHVVVRAPAVPLDAPAAARAAERQLVASGLDTALAADIVGEALVHGLPFGTPRSLKRLVRAVISQRLQTLGHRGHGTLTLAVAGPAGAESSTMVAQLAAAYARAGAAPVVVALRAEDEGAALQRRLEDFSVTVSHAASGAEARGLADGADGAMVLVDLPPVALYGGGGDTELARDLAAIGADELHLALPATTSAAAADELAELLDPLGLTHIALTRMDDTQRAGAGLGFCIGSGRGLSYLSARDGLTPADAASVAQLLLP